MGMFDFDFSWGTKNADIPADVEKSLDKSPASGGVDMARKEIADRISSAAQRRRGSQENSTPSGGDSRLLQAEIAKQLEGCYDPGAWGALLSLPADAAHTYTGRENWKVSKEERQTLGVTGSAAARTLMVTDPRGLAFLMVASALFSVYVPRAIQEMKHQREQKEKAKKNEPPKTNT